MQLTPRAPGRTVSAWNLAAWIVWAGALIGTLIHRLPPHSRASLDIFLPAGERWIHGELLYTNWRGFVYSPLTAVGFAALGLLPPKINLPVWLLLNAAVFLGGFAALLRTTAVSRQAGRFHGIAFLLAAPLALGNLDVLQANALLIGLLMFALSGIRTERWVWAALCIGLTTYLKLYPLAMGMLLVLVAPRRFAIALILVLIALGLATFLFQSRNYVCAQYQAWIVSRAADDRTKYPLKDAALSISFLLIWIGRLPLTKNGYLLLELLSGGAAALFAIVGRRRGWSRERLLAGIFCFGAIWMTLFGPGTEWFTYILLAPAIVFALMESFLRPRPAWSRVAISAAYGMLLFSAFQHSIKPHMKVPWSMAIPPTAALLFLGYCLFWLLDERAWRPAGTEEAPALG